MSHEKFHPCEGVERAWGMLSEPEKCWDKACMSKGESSILFEGRCPYNSKSCDDVNSIMISMDPTRLSIEECLS
jgi:hypothetical protein